MLYMYFSPHPGHMLSTSCHSWFNHANSNWQRVKILMLLNCFQVSVTSSLLHLNILTTLVWNALSSRSSCNVRVTPTQTSKSIYF
jgi:hypothetical protein